jgi:archaellum component FlaG (FlaF/FlaG flagellin family)
MVKMRILPLGTDGFIMLRGLLVMFIVIICFAAVIAAMAVLSRQSSRLLENVQREVNTRNEIVLKRVNQ